MSLVLSPDANALLEQLAEAIHGTKSEVLRRALTLMEVAVTAKKEGRAFGVAKPGQKLEREVIGL